MQDNRHLLVSFSNGVNWNGIMSVELVRERADEEYPNADIEILVSEIHATEKESNCMNHICRRVNGQWLAV